MQAIDTAGNTTSNDADLVARILDGDEAAVAGLVRQWWPLMERVARTYVGNSGVATEVVQDAWMAALAGLPRFEGRSSLRTWMFRILINRARTRGAREARQVPFSSLGGEDNDPVVDPTQLGQQEFWAHQRDPWNGSTPEELLGSKQSMDDIQRAIDTLPSNQRDVMYLRHIEGMDSADVCDMLGISEVNQRVRLHRARTRLRTALAA
jgi:RNA polymerase sigma-70 factor, ECF subfamily